MLERTNKANLKFVGELLASCESSNNNAHPFYSGQTGISQELRLYRTKAGSYVAVRETYTQWQGNHNTYEAEVCKTESEIFEFLGTDGLQKSFTKELKCLMR